MNFFFLLSPGDFFVTAGKLVVIFSLTTFIKEERTLEHLLPDINTHNMGISLLLKFIVSG